MENSTRNISSAESKGPPKNHESSLNMGDGFVKDTSALPKLLTPLADQAAEMGQGAVEKVSEGVRTAEQWVARRAEPRVSRPGKAIENTRQYVAAHPWQSIGVAVAFGLLLARRRIFTPAS